MLEKQNNLQMEPSIDSIAESPVETTAPLTKKEYDSFDHKKKWHIHKILVLSIWAMFIIAGIVLIIRALHFIMPDCWCWLNAEKLQNIDKFLFSGAFGGILAKYAKYIFRPESPE